MSARVISIANQKGGVAKTTTTYNVAAAMAFRGKKVLMIDMDPQASLTISTGVEPDSCRKTIVDVMLKFQGRKRSDIRETILEVGDNIYLVPSVIDLAASDTLLINEMNRERILKKALSGILKSFDYILIDCPPSLNQLFVNALVASDMVLIPVGCDYLAYRGLILLMETIDNVKVNLNEGLEIIGVVATFHNGTIHARENLEELQGKNHVIGVVSTTVRVKDAVYQGKPIYMTDPESKVAQEYDKIAMEVMEYGR